MKTCLTKTYKFCLEKSSTKIIIYNRMRNLHKFVTENHGLEALLTLREWEKWVIMESDYKNHRRFTLRCISKGIILVSVRLKSTSINSSTKTREIIYRAEKTVTTR